jgi:adenosine deaminase CECR1
MGYDLVCEEDILRQNKEYLAQFFAFQDKCREGGISCPFYLHTGESLSKHLENVYDALLVDTKRIGHGLALVRHPAAMREVAKRGICVELNPISNKIIGYYKDIRTHPGPILMANGVKCSISPDDPSVFETVGGIFDWLFSVACWDLDLAGVKKLVVDSIECGGMPEKTMADWQGKWDAWVNELANANID